MQSFRRKAASLDELRAQVLLAYGPEARIADATRVTRKGIGRLFAHDEIEATVVVPDGAGPAGGVAPERVDRAGIAALLADADEADGTGDDERSDAPAPRASTATASFSALLAEVERALGEPAGGATPIPVPGAPVEAAPPAGSLIASAASPGDLVLVVGLGDDATVAARGLVAVAAGAPLRLHGDAPDASGSIADRRAALAARMRAVERDEAVVLARPIGFDDDPAALAELRPDEVWVAVDVSRHLDDTADWVGRLHAVLPVAAVAALGASRTRHPLDLTALGHRVGWIEGAEAARRA